MSPIQQEAFLEIWQAFAPNYRVAQKYPPPALFLRVVNSSLFFSLQKAFSSCLFSFGLILLSFSFLGMKELRPAIVRMFTAGKSKHEISRLLDVPRTTVRDAIQRFEATGGFGDRSGRGRKKSPTTLRAVKKVKSRLSRNPKWSTRKLSKAVETSRRTVQRILKNDLGVLSYKFRTAQLLSTAAKALRLQRARAFKARFAAGRHRSILFSDEKVFTIQQAHNPQNDRIWATEAPPPGQRIVARVQFPKSVMVWAGVTSDGKTPLVFIDQGVKINQKTYQKTLHDKVLPWTRSHFGRRPWTFQQDSAPAHRAQSTQNWLRDHVPDFITAKQWPPSSPDLNPLDFSIWSLLEAKACAKPHTSIESLKKALTKAWTEISPSVLEKVVDSFKKRVQQCIDAEGGHFE